MDKNKAFPTLLTLILGPFGMFYWGIPTGIGSLLGMIIFITITTYFGFDVGFWYQVLIRVVFMSMNNKILKMNEEEKKTFSSMTFTAFVVLVWMTIKNFAVYGFIGFMLFSLFR